MKKISLFILMASISLTSLHAQTVTRKKPNWGLKVGMNASNIRVEDGMDSRWKTGLATGAFFNIRTGNKFSLQPEFLYSSMGGRNLMTTSETSIRLNYFSVPVLVKYQLSNKFSFVAGPQIDVMIQSKIKSTDGFDTVTDNFRENSFYGTGGVEFWPIKCFGVTGRYMYGLNNIAQIGTAKLKNQGAQVMAALRF
jgi:hypothetical protein